MKNRELYKKAINKWGERAQIIKAIEEMSELIKELCKSMGGTFHHDKIVEEIADVEIMIEQMKLIFTDSQIFKREKLIRLKKLLKEK